MDPNLFTGVLIGIAITIISQLTLNRCKLSNLHDTPDWHDLEVILRGLPDGTKFFIRICEFTSTATFLLLRIYEPRGEKVSGGSFSGKYYCFHHRDSPIKIEVGSVYLDKKGSKMVLSKFWLQP